MAVAVFRFFEELNDFLAPARRRREFELACAEAATVKNAIESVGVPHTEVELILVDGESVDFSYRVRVGDETRIAERRGCCACWASTRCSTTARTTPTSAGAPRPSAASSSRATASC
jgi:hypothetical protein